VSANPKNAINGKATVSIKSTTEQGYITITSTSSGLISDSVEVRSAYPGQGVKIELSISTNNIVANGTSTTTVYAAIKDIDGNTLTTANNTVTFSVTGEGTLPSQCVVDAVNGIAQITITSTKKSGIAVVTATSPNLESDSIVINTVPGEVKKIICNVQPATIIADGIKTSTITASLADENGNLVTSSTKTITFSLASGLGALEGTNPQDTASGEATIVFRSTTVAGEAEIKATGSNLSTGTVKVTMTAGSPSKVVLTSNAQQIVADGQNSAVITATIYDVNNNKVDTATNQITFSVIGQGTLNGTNPVNAVGGIATINLIGTTIAGGATVQASAPGLTSGNVFVNTIAGPKTKITLTTSKLQLVADGNDSTIITAKIQDSNGNTVLTATDPITFSITQGTATLTGTNPANAVAGISTITVQSTTKASQVNIKAMDGSLSPGSLSLNVVSGPAYKISLSPSVATILADGMSTSTITATIQDINGNVVETATNLINFTLNGPGDFITSNSVNATSGTAKVVIKSRTQSGTITLDANSTGLQAGSCQVNSKPQAAVGIRLSSNKSQVVADGIQTATITVRIVDISNNTVSDENYSVTFSLTGEGSLQGNRVVNTVDGTGSIVYQASTKTGQGVIKAEVANLTPDTIAIDLIPGSPAKLQLEISSPTLVADDISSTTVKAKILDINNNLVSSANNQVSFSVTGQAELIGANPIAATNGIATIVLKARAKAETVTINATSPDLSADSKNVTLIPQSAYRITLTATKTQLIADGLDTSTITASITDINNNLVNTSTNTVSFAISGSGIIFESPSTLDAVNGKADIVLKSTTELSKGTTISATSSGLETGSLVLITKEGVATKLVVSSNKTEVTADGTSEFEVEVTAEDDYGHRITDISPTVSFTVEGPGILSGENPVVMSNGSAKTTIKATTMVGQIKVTASASGLTSSTTTVIAKAGIPQKLTALFSESVVTADGKTTLEITATAKDINDNIATTYNDDIGFEIINGTGVFIGPQRVRAFQGVAKTTIKVTTIAGKIQVKVTALGGGIVGQYATIQADVTPGVAHRIKLTADINTLPADNITKSQITAKIVDINDNIVTNGSYQIVFSITGMARLVGTNPVNTINGTASIEVQSRLSVDDVVIYAYAEGLVMGAYNIKIVPDIAKKIVVFASKTKIPVTSKLIDNTNIEPLNIQASVQDTNYNRVDSATHTLTIEFSGPGKLPDKVSKQTKNGIAYFDGIYLYYPGIYTVTVKGSGLTSGSVSVIALLSNKYGGWVSRKEDENKIGIDFLPDSLGDDILVEMEEVTDITQLKLMNLKLRSSGITLLGDMIRKITTKDADQAEVKIEFPKDKEPTVTYFYDDYDNDGMVDNTELYETDLRVYRWDGTAKNWIMLETNNVDIDKNKVTAKISSLPGIFALASSHQPRPALTLLYQNWPNPFYYPAETTILYDVSKKEKVLIKIYNIAGELVKTLVEEVKDIGRYQINWDGRNNDKEIVASGIYLCQMVAGSYRRTIKIAFIK